MWQLTRAKESGNPERSSASPAMRKSGSARDELFPSARMAIPLSMNEWTNPAGRNRCQDIREKRVRARERKVPAVAGAHCPATLVRNGLPQAARDRVREVGAPGEVALGSDSLNLRKTKCPGRLRPAQRESVRATSLWFAACALHPARLPPVLSSRPAGLH